MPIRFRCPNCSTLMASANGNSGHKVHCSECAQHVIVPTPPQQPRLGILESVEPDEVQPILVTPHLDTVIKDWQTEESPALPARRSRAKVTRRFSCSTPSLFQACIDGLHHSDCDVLELNRIEFQIKFSFAVAGRTTEHICKLRPSGRNGADLEIISWGPNVENQFDSRYSEICREVEALLRQPTNGNVPQRSSSQAHSSAGTNDDRTATSRFGFADDEPEVDFDDREPDDRGDESSIILKHRKRKRMPMWVFAFNFVAFMFFIFAALAVRSINKGAAYVCVSGAITTFLFALSPFVIPKVAKLFGFGR